MIIKYIKKILRPLKLTDLRNFITDYLESKKRLTIIALSSELKAFKIVRISVKRNTFYEHIQLQSSDRLGVINKTIFATTLNPDINVIINSPNVYVPLISKLKENWLIHIEPPGYIQKLGYNKEKLHNKYTRVYTCDPTLYNKGGKYIASPPFVHWHLEISSYNKGKLELLHDYNFLKSQVLAPDKTSGLAVINSNIYSLPGHKLRADFITDLCNSKFDFNLYGGSKWSKFNQYIDTAPRGKWPIYSTSRYTLVIENEVAPYYWSEKITDAILCWSMPIYFGCPNLSDYLPKGSYINIDITQKDAINKLQKIVESDYYETNLDNLAKARELILDKYNLLNFIDQELNDYTNKKKS